MADGESLRDVGEHAFLERLCRRLRERVGRPSHPASGTAKRILIGPGDDCAVVSPAAVPLAFTTDALIEGTHFRRDWLFPREIGRRAVAVNLSDLAAMGADPVYVLAAVAAPADLAASALDALLDGCAEAAEEAGAVLLGGNISRADALAVTLTAVGEIHGPCLTRAGARPGDLLVVTGTLGDAAAAVERWLGGADPPAELRARFAAPTARLAAGKSLAAAGARAAIDVSDGLLADLQHLCDASGVGAEVERERLPRSAEVAARDAAGADLAATGGEDYELLLACPPEWTDRLDALAREARTPLTAIGHCTAARGVVALRDARGALHRPARSGFDHYRPAAAPEAR